MMQFKHLKLFLPFLALNLLLSCKKEQPQMAELNAGCDCAEEVKGDFVMEEKSGVEALGILYTDSDSIFGNRNVRFRALLNDAFYTWYIGSEVLNTQEVTRYFPNSMVGQTVPITLVTKKKANTICFPNDDGYDSVVKYLTIAQTNLADVYDTTMLEGTYRVKSDVMSDSIEITFDYKETLLFQYYNFYNYDGLGGYCEDQIITAYGFNYRQLWVPPHTNNCNDLGANIFVKKGGKVEIHFTNSGYVNGVKVMDAVKYDYYGRKL